MTRDWQEWHEQYDDPESSLSRRLEDVRRQLAADLDRRAAGGERPVRLLSLCAGDGRDTFPVLAARSDLDVDACLVELEPALAEGARAAGRAAGVDVDVRTGDAGEVATFVDRLPVDVLMLCGIFGNVADDDVELCVRASRSLLRPGGTVLWTRGNHVPGDPTSHGEGPAAWVRGLFGEAGFGETAFVAPDDASYRVGAARLDRPSTEPWPDRLFTFVR